MNADAAPLSAARKKRGRWVAIASVVVLVIVAGVVAWVVVSQPKSSSTSGMSTATASKRTITVVVSGSGSAVAAQSVTVNPQITGTVKKVYVSLGETVAEGDDLYTISSDTVENEYLQAKAQLLQSEQSLSSANGQVEQAESQLYSAKTQKIQAQHKVDILASEPSTAPNHAYNLRIAKRDLHAAKEAVDSAETGVNTAEIGREAARANYKTAKNSYSTAKKNTGETVVTAPSGGVITALPISVGSAVTAGTNSSASSSSGGSSGSAQTVSSGGSAGSSSSSSSSSSSGSSITITDMDSMQVEMTASEVDVPKLAIGQKAKVEFDAISGKTFAGSVKSILPNATTSSGVVNYTVYVKLDTVDPKLRTGMTATVDIDTTSASDVVAVPSAAVKTSNGKKYVLVVGAGGQTAETSVTVGVSDDTYTQIVSGISAGTVVSTGSSTSSSSSSSSSSSNSSRQGGLMMGGGVGGPPAGGPGGN